MRTQINKFKAIVFIALVIISFSCKKDFLETSPLDKFSDANVWSDPVLAELYVNNIYGNIGWGWDMNAGSVDESRSRQEASFDIGNSLITPDNANWGNWNGNYSDIRACNTFFEKVGTVKFDETLIDGKTQKDRMVGEVTFLRAWDYHNLISYYGGVPIITKVYGLKDSFSAPRNTYDECVKFIVDECDKAALLLPLSNSGNNNGRATKGAALALKAKVLLYAASDLHNPQKNSLITTGYSNPEFLGYTSGDAAARWKAAKDAAKAVIDMNVYSLYKANPAPGENTSQNYSDLFTSRQSSEDIFVRFFAASVGQGVNGWDVTPNGWYGNGGVGAVNELVEDYEMADGSRFNRSNPAHAAEPYKNRDPRFYASILFEGAKWRPRPADLTGVDPVGVMQVGTWEKWDNATSTKTFVYGLDSRNSIANSWNNNTSGATMRKYLDPTVDIQAAAQDLTWRYFRYGEILLNYAEACIELGEDAEARSYINMIRKRAGMPEVTESGDALKMRYRNERRVELAYENQRFFDVRRWLIADQAYHPMHGVSVLYPLNPDHTTAAIPTITPIVIQLGAWLDKSYFFPISRGEVNKNDKLVQNPKY